MKTNTIIAVVFLIGLFLILAVFSGVQKTSNVKQISTNPISVHIHFKENSEQVEALYQKLRVEASKNSIENEVVKKKSKRQGFHYFKNGESHIVLIKPSLVRYKEFESLLGHEMTHALFGEFHPPSGKLPSRISMLTKEKP